MMLFGAGFMASGPSCRLKPLEGLGFWGFFATPLADPLGSLRREQSWFVGTRRSQKDPDPPPTLRGTSMH